MTSSSKGTRSWHFWLCVGFSLSLVDCGSPRARKLNPREVAAVQQFVDDYTEQFLGLEKEAAEAEWGLNTRIVDGDEQNKQSVEAASGAKAKFTGSAEVIYRTREYLAFREQLDGVQVRQLETILYAAGNNPQTVADLVRERIEAEAEQTEALFGFDFRIDGKEVSTNDIDRVLEESTDEAHRLRAWVASKEVGPHLKTGLANLVRLRNASVAALGHESYFAYQVSDYGMSVSEMMGLMVNLLRDVRPLYREIHTWARYELAARYGKEVPDLIPAHWLPNRWGQSWSAHVEVEGFDLDGVLAKKSAEWVVGQAEDFYISLGFDALPETFHVKSSLYPLREGTPYKKNNHASAWHMDLDQDVRCLMSVEPNSRWYETTHHELGHIYYYLSYSHPDCPPLLRGGANRAFHEAVGSLLGIASMHPAFLQARGLLPSDAEVDSIGVLLKEALDFIVFASFSAGTMTHFERDLYGGDLGVDEYNHRWWEYVRRFQGIAAPYERGEEFCDAATKTHINDDAAQYYDYTLSHVLLHQLHAHISREILGQDPRNSNYYGSREVGDYLKRMLSIGATRDWRAVMREFVGEEFSIRAMLEYFAPLTAYLKAKNRGRQATLPELEF